MRRVAILDTGPLGLITHPGSRLEVRECQIWMESLLGDGVHFLIPSIADYELRRELIRSKRHRGLARLDALIDELGLLPLDRHVIQEAARLWAEARSVGLPTAHDQALDGDCILAAHANRTFQFLNKSSPDADLRVIVATTNLKHLSQMTSARHWRDLNLSFD